MLETKVHLLSFNFKSLPFIRNRLSHYGKLSDIFFTLVQVFKSWFQLLKCYYCKNWVLYFRKPLNIPFYVSVISEKLLSNTHPGECLCEYLFSVFALRNGLYFLQSVNFSNLLFEHIWVAFSFLWDQIWTGLDKQNWVNLY